MGPTSSTPLVPSVSQHPLLLINGADTELRRRQGTTWVHLKPLQQQPVCSVTPQLWHKPFQATNEEEAPVRGANTRSCLLQNMENRAHNGLFTMRPVKVLNWLQDTKQISKVTHADDDSTAGLPLW